MFIIFIFLFCLFGIFFLFRLFYPNLFIRCTGEKIQKKELMQLFGASGIVLIIALFFSLYATVHRAQTSKISFVSVVASSTKFLHTDIYPTTTQTTRRTIFSVQSIPSVPHFLLLTEPQDGISPILYAIGHARTSIDLVMYELEDIQIEQALAVAEARGVSVRVLLNGGYYGKPDRIDHNQSAYNFFLSYHIPIRWTSSYFALTHQKTLIIDKNSAFIMTFNFTPQYYLTSRDFGIEDRDAKDVSAIETVFSSDWNDNQKVAGMGDNLIWSPGSSKRLLSLIQGAKTSIAIYNEEMKDSKIKTALEHAAKNGVNVEIVMTSESNWLSAFEQLTTAGVHIHFFTKDAPLYIHAKMILVDKKRVFLGSENFSYTSLEQNRELGVLLTNPIILVSLEHTFQTDFLAATPFYSHRQTGTSSIFRVTSTRYYTSSYYRAKYYYPSACAQWKNLGVKYRVSFSSIYLLLITYPKRILNPRCLS